MTGSDAEVVVLYRPVGQEELDLIAGSGWRAFPPRLESQPIFYPVLNEPYATRIARDWNTKAGSGVGYVTRFAVRRACLDPYEVHQVGDEDHLEYWIPAADLAAFNASIVGEIEVVSQWHGDPPQRVGQS